MNDNNGHLTVGIIGAKYLLSTLTQIGRAGMHFFFINNLINFIICLIIIYFLTDVAWTVATKTDFASWENFATQGGTTLWEHWQDTTYPLTTYLLFFPLLPPLRSPLSFLINM
jgi:hypothetical protein